MLHRKHDASRRRMHVQFKRSGNSTKHTRKSATQTSGTGAMENNVVVLLVCRATQQTKLCVRTMVRKPLHVRFNTRCTHLRTPRMAQRQGGTPR
jgi:hypothetical protein